MLGLKREEKKASKHDKRASQGWNQIRTRDLWEYCLGPEVTMEVILRLIRSHDHSDDPIQKLVSTCDIFSLC